MLARARWLLAGVVLVPGLVIGALAPAFLSSPDATLTPFGELSFWLAVGAVLLVTFGLGLAALQLWWIGPLQHMARHLDDVPVPPDADALARLEAALAYYRKQSERTRAAMSGQLDAADALRGEAQGARQHLAEADRMALVGRVAMGVTHELGGPLALLSGWLERLRALELADAPATERQVCVDQAEHAARQIERLLTDLARPGLQRTRDADRPCDLLAVVLRLAAQADAHPRLRQVTLDIEAHDQTHPADVSASHIEQVLWNLILNAADAMKQQGRIVLRLAREGEWQVLHVDDNGPGVPMDLRARIFEPMFSTHADPQRPGQSGWGLGLSISQRAVAEYGGALTVAESPEGGARLTVRLRVPGGTPG